MAAPPAPIARVHLAERWGVFVGLLTTLVMATGVPERIGLSDATVAGLLTAAILLAPMARGAWQAWRAGDLAGAVDRVEAVVTDPRVADVLRDAVGKAAAEIVAAKRKPDFSARPIVERNLRPGAES